MLSLKPVDAALLLSQANGFVGIEKVVKDNKHYVTGNPYRNITNYTRQTVSPYRKPKGEGVSYGHTISDGNSNPTCIVEHNGHYYLKCSHIRTNERITLIDGEEATEGQLETLEEFKKLSGKSVSKIRRFKLNVGTKIKVEGKSITIV